MSTAEIKAIIGLGNPGPLYKKNRHNIGFLIVDALAAYYHASWQYKDLYDIAELVLHDRTVVLIKPKTFMNSSGKVIPMLLKKGIKAEQIMVVHDEMEKSLGSMQIRLGGSARGHNGLKSIIEVIGQEFYRFRFGVERPERKEDVADWVLSNFNIPAHQLDELVTKAVEMIREQLQLA